MSEHVLPGEEPTRVTPIPQKEAEGMVLEPYVPTEELQEDVPNGGLPAPKPGPEFQQGIYGTKIDLDEPPKTDNQVQ